LLRRLKRTHSRTSSNQRIRSLGKIRSAPCHQEVGGEETVSEGDETTEEVEAEVKPGEVGAKQIKAAIEAIKASGDVKTAKLLNDTYFKHNAVMNELGVKTVDEARTMKAALDTAGGADGIAQLQTKASTLDLVDSNFEKGDPSVVKDMSEAFPEGFKKIVPAAMDEYKKLDAAGFGNALRPHALEFMQQAGFVDALNQIDAALQTGDGPAIDKIVKTMAAWFKGQQQQVGAKPKADPEREQFEKDRTEFRTKQENDFRSGVGNAASVHYNAVLDKALAPFIKQHKLSKDAIHDAKQGIFAEVGKLNTKTYSDTLKANFAAKDRNAANIQKYIEANLDVVVPKAVNNVMARRYKSVATPTVKNTPTKVNTPANKMGGSAVPVALPKAPVDADIDWSKDRQQLLFITNKAFMKSGPYRGKLVTWK
jgi:hypothetical protein